MDEQTGEETRPSHATVLTGGVEPNGPPTSTQVWVAFVRVFTSAGMQILDLTRARDPTLTLIPEPYVHVRV